MTLDPARCYRAILAKDARFDGRFFTGVKTTGVYCRPVCPVAPPKAKNVVYFGCAAAAEAAGFRPCMRCRPETAPGTPAWVGTSAVVARALRLIERDGFEDDDVEAFAGRFGIGARQLRRLFARHLGASPADVARVRRVHLARALLDDTDLAMHEVAAVAGFRSVRQFNHAVRATFRAAPTALRARRARPGEERPRDRLVVRLPYRPPLAWDDLLAFLAARAIPGVEHVGGGAYRRTAMAGEAPVVVEIAPAARPQLTMAVTPAPAPVLLDLVARARRLLDLAADPQEIGRHLRRSPRLRPLVAARPGLRVPGAWEPFELAVRAVLGQQVTVRGATTLAGRLVQAFGTPLPVATGALTHVFPTPAALADAAIERIGVPRARAATIRALASDVASGRLSFDVTAGLEAAVERLIAIPGIGPWTAHYVAMRACGEPDAFPAGDLGVRRALGNGHGPLPVAAVEALSEAWRPWRSYAVLHLWSEEQHT